MMDMICPKCGVVSSHEIINEYSECPSCGVIYSKFATAARRAQTSVDQKNTSSDIIVRPSPDTLTSSKLPVSKRSISKKQKYALIVVGLMFFGFIANLMPNNSSMTRSTSVAQDPSCSIKKADGSSGGRECDLVELCKDRRWLAGKYDSARTFDDKIAIMADLNQTQRWLSEYRPEDVKQVCSQN